MDETCQVDFYVLGSHGQSAEVLACRLAMMAWEQGHRVAVLTVNTRQACQLDEMMWSYPAGRFLPHSIVTGGDRCAPVLIGTEESAMPADCEVVINLASAAVTEPGKFRRLLEIVPGGEAERSASRQKFRVYRGLGLKPASHTIGK